MPWTKTRKPITHRCATPSSVEFRDVSDEWTCEYCGQVWIVRMTTYRGKVLEEK